MAIDRNSAQPLQAQVADDIRRRITQGEFAAGDRLPALRALTAEYEVAEMTVHTAIRELQRDGWLHSSRGRGTFVSENIEESIRQVAATEAAGIDALRTEVAELRVRVERMEAAIILRAGTTGSPDESSNG